MGGRREPASSARRGVVAAFLAGLLAAVSFQWSYADASGGWAALLHVGESGRYRSVIEQELGDVPLAPSIGHDGQASYVIARDPLASQSTATMLDNPSYRYRRYIYPLVAGGFGAFGPGLTLAGLVMVAAAGLGLSAASVASMGATPLVRRWALAGVLLNPGLYESARLLTPDVFAFGLSAAGAALALRGRRVAAVVTLCAAVLTKEVYVLVPLGLAGYLWHRDRRSSLVTAGVPAIVASASTGFLLHAFGYTQVTHKALSLPFVGIIRAGSAWASGHMLEVGAVSAAVLSLSVIGLLVARSRLLWWLGLPWVALALSSSALVWIADAARAFAPLWLIAAVSVGILAERRQQERAGRRHSGGLDYVEASLDPSVA